MFCYWFSPCSKATCSAKSIGWVQACEDDESVAETWSRHFAPSSLEHCLEKFSCPETLDALIHCDTCNEKTKRDKVMTIWRLPRYLVSCDGFLLLQVITTAFSVMRCLFMILRNAEMSFEMNKSELSPQDFFFLKPNLKCRHRSFLGND